MAARTLTQYLLDLGRKTDGHDYAHVLSAVAISMKLIAATVSRGPLITPEAIDGRGFDAASVNEHLRRLAASVLVEQASGVCQLAAISIEGEPDIHPIASGPQARYLLAVEAMHGLLKLTENQAVGVSFSIMERDPCGRSNAAVDSARDGDDVGTESVRPKPTGENVEEEGAVVAEDSVGSHEELRNAFLQPGRGQVCAGMALFGPSTVLVLTTGDGVDGFTLDRDVGNFVLTHPRLRVPEASTIVAINPSGSLRWPAPVKRYVDECLQGRQGPRGDDFIMRWNASAVMGAFRVLMNGGIFIIPDEGRANPARGLGDASEGVAFSHTGAPLALLIEQAGGCAINGAERMLDLAPDSLSQRTPIIFGACEEVGRLKRYFVEHEKGYDTELLHPLFHDRSLFFRG